MNTKLQDCVFIKRLSRQSTHSDTSRAPAHSCCREFANTRHAMSSLAMCAYHASGIVAAKRASAGAASSSQRWRDPGGAISSPPPARPGGPARASVPRRDAAEPTPNLDETPSCFACPVCSGAMIRRSSGGSWPRSRRDTRSSSASRRDSASAPRRRVEGRRHEPVPRGGRAAARRSPRPDRAIADSTTRRRRSRASPRRFRWRDTHTSPVTTSRGACSRIHDSNCEPARARCRCEYFALIIFL